MSHASKRNISKITAFSNRNIFKADRLESFRLYAHAISAVIKRSEPKITESIGLCASQFFALAIKQCDRRINNNFLHLGIEHGACHKLFWSIGIVRTRTAPARIIKWRRVGIEASYLLFLDKPKRFGCTGFHASRFFPTVIKQMGASCALLRKGKSFVPVNRPVRACVSDGLLSLCLLRVDDYKTIIAAICGTVFCRIHTSRMLAMVT